MKYFKVLMCVASLSSAFVWGMPDDCIGKEAKVSFSVTEGNKVKLDWESTVYANKYMRVPKTGTVEVAAPNGLAEERDDVKKEELRRNDILRIALLGVDARFNAIESENGRLIAKIDELTQKIEKLEKEKVPYLTPNSRFEKVGTQYTVERKGWLLAYGESSYEEGDVSQCHFILAQGIRGEVISDVSSNIGELRVLLPVDSGIFASVVGGKDNRALWFCADE